MEAARFSRPRAAAAAKEERRNDQRTCRNPVADTSPPESSQVLPRPNQSVGYDLALVCRSCGDRWLVAPGRDGEFFPGFWLCPRGCDY